MRVAGLAALVCLCLSGSAAGRGYRVEDMLRLESYGAVRIDPGCRWAIIEKVLPYDQGPRFTYESFNDRTRTRLYRVDLKGAARLLPLLTPEAGAGYWIGGFSPSGRRLALFKLKDDRLSAGILTMATGEIVWLAVSPDLPRANPQPVWIDDDHLLLVARRQNDLPPLLGFYGQTTRTLPARWAAMAAGRTSSVEILSTTDLAAETAAADTDLRRVDVRSGVSTILMSGDITDIDLSPDRRHVAIVQSHGEAPLSPDRPVEGTSPAERLSLNILDLATGGLLAPAAGDILPYLLRWNARGDALLFAVKTDAVWSTAALYRLDVASGRLRPLTHDPDQLALPIEDGVTIAHALWLGNDPVALFGDSGGKKHWLRWRGGTASDLLPSSEAPMAPDVWPAIGGLWISTARRLMFEDRSGRIRQMSKHPVASGPGRRVDPWKDGLREFFNPGQPITDVLAEDGSAGAATSYAASVHSILTMPVTVPAGADIKARTPDGSAAIAVMKAKDGSAALALLTPNRPPVLLDRINGHLADIDRPDFHPLAVRLANGDIAYHWLITPPEKRSARPPLVVLPYPGTVYAGSRQPDLRPARVISPANPLLLLGAGFAVLLPSLPLPPDAHDPLDTVTSMIEQATDAAMATGLVDASRIALYGQSYGGYAALGVATRSTRFKAVIASAAIGNLTMSYGAIDPRDRRASSAFGSARAMMGWHETGQGRMGGPPWAFPDRYARNSPLFGVDRITAPILLIQGDMDFVSALQGDQMLSALYRLDKDATLLRYAGESHTLVSPANIADQWRRIIAWLQQKLAIPVGSDTPLTPR